jgi:L-amino acid N-acyltransferase YncA
MGESILHFRVVPSWRGSLALHERFGFVRVGLPPAVAYRYGKWADTVMVQRSLGPGSTPPPRG